jgi:hypothetical protein
MTIPYTDYERLALLKEIESGEKVVIPVSVEHARCMIMVAQAYIGQDQQQMWDILKGPTNVKTY